MSLKGLGDRCKDFCGYSFVHNFLFDSTDMYALITDPSVGTEMFAPIQEMKEDVQANRQVIESMKT